jgi:TAG lipase/lysophosphatidylethanolamine acyltransferase
LHETDNLPKVIAGSGIGALIAAILCVKTDKELPIIFTKEGINLEAFSKKDAGGAIKRKLNRLLKHGNLNIYKVICLMLKFWKIVLRLIWKILLLRF